MSIVLVHVPGAKLTPEQRQQIAKSLKKCGVENPVISDGVIQVGVPAPYQLTESVGDYQTAYGFPTESEMVRFEQKQKDGYWYDWQNGESNHPDWTYMCRSASIVITDRETGDEVRDVLFYHEGTGYLERRAVDEKGYGALGGDSGNIALIIERGRVLDVVVRAELSEPESCPNWPPLL